MEEMEVALEFQVTGADEGSSRSYSEYSQYSEGYSEGGKKALAIKDRGRDAMEPVEEEDSYTEETLRDDDSYPESQRTSQEGTETPRTATTLSDGRYTELVYLKRRAKSQSWGFALDERLSQLGSLALCSV